MKQKTTEQIDKEAEFEKKYGISEHGNFRIINTIGVPHPYMITVAHVSHASNHFAGVIGVSTIESAEKVGVVCGICRGKLKYKEHEQALLVACKLDIKAPNSKPDKENKIKMNKELHAFLTKIKEKATKDGYAGFSFIRVDE